MKSFEPEIGDDVFSLFCGLIYEASGIRLAPSKKGLLATRLLRRLRSRGIGDFYAYYHQVKKDPGEFVEMLNCVATNTTMFFRETYHFDFLRTRVLPAWLRAGRDGTFRIWSAGCATGEETYSIAISCAEALRQSGAEGSGSLLTLGTDISTRALETAEAGIYELDQFPDAVERDYLRKYFLRGVGEDEGKIRVRDSIRESVRFRRLNLKDTHYPFSRMFDAIFCRNVMIYFDDAMRQHLLSMFERHLVSGGHLFLGHAEALLSRDTFVPVHLTVYRKI